MIFHRINIPTVTNTIGEPGKQDSTQNSSDHIQQKQADENKELNITLEQAKIQRYRRQVYLSKYILKKQSWILKMEDGNMKLSLCKTMQNMRQRQMLRQEYPISGKLIEINRNGDVLL